MNPAIPLLAVLGMAGLLLLRKDVRLVWGALAIAGMALLAPALSIPDGIPSPAATEPGCSGRGGHDRPAPRCGWRASAGGKPVPVVPVDGALLGVELGPGAGNLELRYRPAGLVAGAWLTLLGLLGLAALFRRRNPRP